MKQFRSARGTLATKARDALFTYFGDVNLPRINTSAPPIEISNWKKSNKVRKCYNKLSKIIIRYWQGFLRKFLEKTFPSLHIQRSRSQFVHRFLTRKRSNPIVRRIDESNL